ncbi:MAG: efflux RND transporter periplasmic adaptor subunit, partial [Coleofasciculus sp. S288]|nr:efflux RND transporter periplasmic adaptor subunit [Coleofasciculus sp. S288]
MPFLTGCALPKTEAEAQSTPPGGQQGGGITSVDVAIARTGVIQEPKPIPGRTKPVREVSLRAQVEGRLLDLQVDVGDHVSQGQILARLDDSLLVTAVSQAQSELTALQSEVARAQTQVSNARAQAEQARAELSQAKTDAARRQTLVRQGAISKQEAELAQTAARTAEQTLQAALAQIDTEQQAVAAARGRVEAQRATVAQAKERQSYALLAAPINGVVLEKVSEPGNLIQPGGEVLKLGDFSQVKAVVNVTDSQRSNIRVGQSVKVELDAFPNESFSGRVSRIVPVANALQIPVEITFPNSNGQIGSELLARVIFEDRTASRVVVPQSALPEGEGCQESGVGNNPQSSETTVFVVTGEGAEAKVQARRVQVGKCANNQVEILSGLQPGERFVARSGKPLKDGESVRFSAVSET